MFLLITSNVTKKSSNVPSSSNNVTLSSNNVPFSSNNVTLCSNNVPSSSNNGLVLGLCLYFVGLWLCTDFSQSWSCFFWAVVVFRLPSVVRNLATRAFGGTVVYPREFYSIFQGGFTFYPMSLKCLV